MKDTVDVETPDSSIVALVCTQSFTIHRIPHIWLRIFSTWKEQVTFPVVFDLSNGPFMAVQHKGFLSSQQINYTAYIYSKQTEWQLKRLNNRNEIIISKYSNNREQPMVTRMLGETVTTF